MIPIPGDIIGLQVQEEETWIVRHTLPVTGPNQYLHLFIGVEGNPAGPMTGLTFRTLQSACFLRPESSSPEPLQLTDGPAGGNACGFREIDPDRMPGMYTFEVPAALRAQGRTFIHLAFQGACPQYIEINGVNYDPYDSFALGLETWIRTSCTEHLSAGLRKSMPSVMAPLLADWRSQREKV